MTDDLRLIVEFLARRDVRALTLEELGSAADVLVVAGHRFPESARVAADAITAGAAQMILITGGIGRETQPLRNNISKHPVFHEIKTDGRTEARIFKDLLVEHYGVSERIILIEDQSTNSGENASMSCQLIADTGLHVQRMILVQDPIMQRRLHATFERACNGRPSLELISYASFIPIVEMTSEGEFTLRGEPDGMWPFEQFVTLTLIEIAKLIDDENGFGPSGRNYFDRVEVPASVLNAYRSIANRQHSSA